MQVKKIQFNAERGWKELYTLVKLCFLKILTHQFLGGIIISYENMQERTQYYNCDTNWMFQQILPDTNTWD